jgi:hypothetical protein
MGCHGSTGERTMTNDQEAKRKQFCAASGEADYRWKEVELALFEVFSALMPSSDASAIFHANDHLMEGVRLVDRLIYRRAYGSVGALTVEWEQLKKRCEDANTNRNAIAHWPLTARGSTVLQKDFHDLEIERRRMHVKPMPPHGNPFTFNQVSAQREREATRRAQRFDALQQRRLSTPEIGQIAVEFQALSADLGQFAARAAYIMSLATSSNSKKPGPRAA